MSDLMMNTTDAVPRLIRQTLPKHPLGMLRIALRTYLTRRELPELNARELADLGLNRMTALQEAARLPWDYMPRRWQNTGGSGSGSGSGIVRRMREALERARTRRLLVRVQARELRDLGISFSDAQAEADKPAWRR